MLQNFKHSICKLSKYDEHSGFILNPWLCNDGSVYNMHFVPLRPLTCLKYSTFIYCMLVEKNIRRLMQLILWNLLFLFDGSQSSFVNQSLRSQILLLSLSSNELYLGSLSIIRQRNIVEIVSLTTMGNSTLSMTSHALRHEHIVIKHLRSKAAQSLFGTCKSNLNPRHQSKPHEKPEVEPPKIGIVLGYVLENSIITVHPIMGVWWNGYTK